MKLTTDITRQDYFEYSKFVYVKNRLKTAIIVWLVALVVLSYSLHDDQSHWLGTVIFCILMTGIYSLFIYIALLWTKRSPKGNGSILGKKEIEFLDDKITFKTEDAEGTYKWKMIKEVDESKKAIYLFFDTNMAIIVPKRIFENEQELAKFKQLLGSKSSEFVT